MENSKKKIWIVILAVLLALAIAAIYPSWNEMWNDFGHNLYYFFHGR